MLNGLQQTPYHQITSIKNYNISKIKTKKYIITNNGNNLIYSRSLF